MPYETIRYHCNICREPYKKYAEAVRCERLNHLSRTIWHSRGPQRKSPAQPEG
jgi:hypothetical protein